MKMGIVLFLNHTSIPPFNLSQILYFYGFLDSVQRKVLSVCCPSSPPASVAIKGCSSHFLKG